MKLKSTRKYSLQTDKAISNQNMERGVGGLVVEHQTSNCPGFDCLWAPCCVPKQDTLSMINSLEYWLVPRKWWLCHNMTEQLLTLRNF